MFDNLKREVEISQMTALERKTTIEQLKSYRDELMNFMGFKNSKDMLSDVSEMERSRENLRLINELASITNIIIKHE
jgi:hypothetical protein